MLKTWVFIGTSLLLLVGCGGQSNPVVLPIGLQTMTGTVLPTELSPLKRGTHMLTKNGHTIALLESQTVNLRSFEGREVGVTGVFEPNSDPSLPPVLVAQTVQATEDLKDLSIPGLGIAGRIPRTWEVGTSMGATTLTQEGGDTPLGYLARDPSVTSLPAGVPFLLDGRHATRRSGTASGSEVTTVDLGDGFLVLRFVTDGSDDPGQRRAQWLTFLTSVKISRAASAASSLSTTSSTGEDGKPCGGPAGVLCPAGEYCAITDWKENIGHCTKIGIGN